MIRSSWALSVPRKFFLVCWLVGDLEVEFGVQGRFLLDFPLTPLCIIPSPLCLAESLFLFLLNPLERIIYSKLVVAIK